MTREDIIRWAREVEDYADTIYQKGEYHPGWVEVRDQRFAALVAAAEREACRMVCKTLADAAQEEAYYRGHMECEAAIRARGAK